MASPMPARSLLLSKFLLSALFTSAVGVSLTAIAGLLFGASAGTTTIELGVVIVSAAALCGLGVGLSAAFPRFVYENPAHRVSTWALVLGFFASTAYVVVSGILFAVGWLVATNLPDGNLPAVVYGCVILAYLSLSALTVYIPIVVGARRIEGYQWEH